MARPWICWRRSWRLGLVLDVLAQDRNERVPPSPTVFRKSAQLSLATSCYIQLCHTMSYICHTMSSFAFLSFSRNHSSHAKTILCFFICRCSLHFSIIQHFWGEKEADSAMPCWTLSVPLEALKSMQVNAGSPSAAGWRILRSGASPGAVNSTWHSSIFQHIHSIFIAYSCIF